MDLRYYYCDVRLPTATERVKVLSCTLEVGHHTSRGLVLMSRTQTALSG